MARVHYTMQMFIDAIPGSGGIISTIAARVGCDWYTVKRYIDKYATIRRAYEDECEKVADLAESVVIGEIKNKDIQTAKWYLMMKGRSRGYVQSQHVDQYTEYSGEVGLRIIEEVVNDGNNQDSSASSTSGISEE